MIILMADNNPPFLATRSDYLEQAGHTVIRAGNPADAEYVLRNVYVHAAVLDVRMIDEDDDTDVSGLCLATHPDFRNIPKLILTGFATIRHANEAMQPDAQGLPGAYGYIEKRETPEIMVRKVEDLRARLRINDALRIHSDPRALLSAANLATLIAPPPAHKITDDQPPEDYALELDDLIRRAFYDYDQITLQQLLWRRDCRFALVVLAYAPAGHREKDAAFIVTCGPAAAIKAEAESFRQNVPAILEPEPPIAVKTTTTIHFGLNTYRMAETEFGGARRLRDYFADASQRQFGEILEALAAGPLRGWHAQTRVEAPTDLARIVADSLPFSLSETAGSLSVCVAAIASQVKAHGLADFQVSVDDMRLTLPRLIVEELPNPARCLAGAPLRTAERAVQYGTLINALDGDTILVAPPGRSWLTDYGALTNGPLVADYAALEVAIKFDLTECADSLERYELEKALIEPRQLDARPNVSVPPFLVKTLVAVRRLRKCAAATCGSDAQPYYAALFAATTKRLLQLDPYVRYTRQEVSAYLHAALSLGLICRRLLATNSTENPSGVLQLRLNERRVLVGATPIALTPNEFDLLSFLWSHIGDVCARSDVERAVFGNVLLTTDSARLNVVINRLRAKIEPDPKDPSYLVTVRGHGFRLHPEGKPRAASAPQLKP